jgi:hypothetical protein
MAAEALFAQCAPFALEDGGTAMREYGNPEKVARRPRSNSATALAASLTPARRRPARSGSCRGPRASRYLTMIASGERPVTDDVDRKVAGGRSGKPIGCA